MNAVSLPSRAGKALRARRKPRKLRQGKKRRSLRFKSKRRLKRIRPPELPNGYEQGYLAGLADGAESLLVQHLPPDVIIPEITAAEAMAAGVQVLRARGYPLISPLGLYHEMEEALSENRPYAFIRLGDGELLTLAQEAVLSVEEVSQIGHFLPYAGIHVPNFAARDELAAAIRVASIVGVPTSRHPHFQPMVFRVLRAHGIDFGSIRYTTSIANYAMYDQGYLQQLMRGRRLLVIGNVAQHLAHTLRDQGYHVAGVVTPVNGYGDVRRVVNEASRIDFDLALVSAGVPAIPIVVQLVQRTGKVAMDFGHLANRISGFNAFA